jgi:putative copper export protein
MTLDTIRIFLHILAASIWVGGQFVLANVVSGLRRDHRDALPVVARAFARIAWPAFGTTVVTGVWSLLSIDTLDSDAQIALALKIVAVVVSGGAAAAHSVSSSRLVKALGGALGSIAAVIAMLLAVIVSTSA